MTPGEINREIAEKVGTADQWLIVKHGLFYRPEARGYTSHESEAGKWPFAQAKEHERLCVEDPVTIKQATIPPYSSSLDALHEALQSLTEVELFRYADEVCDLTCDSNHDTDIQTMLMLSAKELAECYVRAIGKWRGA